MDWQLVASYFTVKSTDFFYSAPFIFWTRFVDTWYSHTRNIAIGFHCTQPIINIRPLSGYDSNTVDKAVNCRPSIHQRHLWFQVLKNSDARWSLMSRPVSLPKYGGVGGIRSSSSSWRIWSGSGSLNNIAILWSTAHATPILHTLLGAILICENIKKMSELFFLRYIYDCCHMQKRHLYLCDIYAISHGLHVAIKIWGTVYLVQFLLFQRNFVFWFLISEIRKSHNTANV